MSSMPIFFKNVSCDEKKLRKEDEKASFFWGGRQKMAVSHDTANFTMIFVCLINSVFIEMKVCSSFFEFV